MAKPSTRAELQAYCKRQLGEPVLQINVAQEQIDDLTDDAFQKFSEWTYNGAEKMLLKHEVTADDVTRFASSNQTTTVAGSTTEWTERDNYILVPEHVYGISRIFGIKSSGIRGNLFGIEYQIFLNELYHFGAIDILNYYMKCLKLNAERFFEKTILRQNMRSVVSSDEMHLLNTWDAYYRLTYSKIFFKKIDNRRWIDYSKPLISYDVELMVFAISLTSIVPCSLDPKIKTSSPY